MTEIRIEDLKTLLADLIGSRIVWGHDTIAYDNPVTLRIGFTDVQRGMAYTVPLKAVKEAFTWLPQSFMELLLTPEGRAQVFGAPAESDPAEES